MKREGYPDSTVESTGNRLRNLARDCSLDDPLSVKRLIAAKDVSVGFKLICAMLIVTIYNVMVGHRLGLVASANAVCLKRLQLRMWKGL